MRHSDWGSTTVILAAVSLTGWPAHAAEQQRHNYHLPAQSLAGALQAVAARSGMSVAAPAATLEGRRAIALDGDYTAIEAIEALLAGSGLKARRIGSGIVIERMNETVADAKPDAGEVVVTGSRIKGAPVASPVIVLSDAGIRNSGQTSLGQVVRSIPQSFGGGQNPGIGLNVPERNGSDIGGGSSLNLRGIGADATLTLLNGHRVSYSGSRQSVDVSAIPLSAVDRVEVVPDGASAIYGSDAVAGVANIILKRDFRGLETRAVLGASTDGGNFTQQYGALGGDRWDGGGLALAYEFNRNSSIQSSQRSYARDQSPGLTLFPSIRSHNALLTGHQALGENLTFSVDALYNRRHEYLEYPLDFGGDLTAFHGERTGWVRSWVVAPSLEYRAGGDWRMGVTGSVASDRARFLDEEFSGTTLDFRSAGCYCNKARTLELSAGGSLARLPGGALRVALGGGYRSNTTDFQSSTSSSQSFRRSQDSYYGYLEVSLPVVAPAMAVSGISRLQLTGAVRYERYPGIGDIATPKFGLTYAPDRTFELKASWGRSFRAPTLRQQFQPTGVSLYRASSVGGTGFPAGAVVAVVDGGRPDLRPERARSWSATLVLHPPALTGARVELSYFDTVYRDRIVSPIDRISQALSNPVYRDYVTLAPSVAQITDVVAGAPSFFNYSGAPFNPATVVAIADASRVNAGRQHFHGIDALASYRLTLAGTDRALTVSANATYLTSNQQLTPALPVTKLAGIVFNPPRFRARGSAAWTAGPLTLNADLSYIGPVRDNRTTPAARIAGMTPLDLTARYLTSRNGPMGGLDLSLTVQNVFNDKPAQLAGIFFEAPYDSTNYSPVGRYVAASVAKTW